jgi:hypothetical protein
MNTGNEYVLIDTTRIHDVNDVIVLNRINTMDAMLTTIVLLRLSYCDIINIHFKKFI